MPHAGGWHQASWRRPNTKGNDIWNFDMWRDLARTAERGMLDAVFMADNQSLWPVPEHLRHHTAKVGVWDALIMTTAMATATEKIGLVATAHTEFHQPYELARQLACIDHLSHGRAGWNIVTSAGPQDAKNFSDAGQISTELRYEKAAEFVDVVKKLWDSWEDDAYLLDQEAGIFFDPAKLHPTNFAGKHYYVEGPFNVMRPPQGYPVLAQAGSSGPGRQLAATTGEIIFSPLGGAVGKAYRDDVLRIAADAGRAPGDVKILSQITPVIGRTDDEAQEKWNWLQEHLHPDLARGVVESMLGIDLSPYPLDEPLPDLGATDRIQGYRDAVLSYTVDGRRPTVREFLTGFKGPGTVVGSAETIADYIEAEVDNGAGDGFVLCLQGCPEELEDFVDLVVPELQRRGRFRTEYEADTLRGHLGFARPSNQFTAVAARA
ncbi:LLM class flavin-dependent oxidoreductase [Rhodococcus sp. 14C212]|uniref:LLM class flavin-dependent oxidoreductase n=1 Tax=Rhodococcus sp. 14C212 TaxID=2711209 RepID=UPI0013ECA1EF|nr:LLM class flavin-dependent oxidoreductase [Rhodococcus sp. 14C212]NGP09464.1 LLM class flavin-dependent oxidoreductase [Rhodococcus sp. 14C212]